MQTSAFFVAGATSAGKTTFIQTISEIPLLYTDSMFDSFRPSGEPAPELAFGRVTVDDTVIYLLGNPEDEPFEMAHVPPGVTDVVLLVDTARDATVYEALPILDDLRRHMRGRYVIAANKRDRTGAVPLDLVAEILGLRRDEILVPCIASDLLSVKEVLLTLVSNLPEDDSTDNLLDKIERVERDHRNG